MQRIRFGIMCYGNSLAAWEAEVVRKLLAIDGVEVALLIVEKQIAPAAVRRPPWKRLYSLLTAKNALWILYQRLCVDGRMEAMRPVDLSPLLAPVPRIECEVIRKGAFSEYFQPHDLDEIRRHNLDFVLRFAFGIIRGEVLTTPRYGVWSFHHDDEERYRGGPPGFWEIYHRDPRSGVILQRLTDRLDGGIVLRKGFFPTALGSYTRNRDAGLFGCVEWPAEVCRDLQCGDTARLDAAPSKSSAPVYRNPGNAQMIVFLLRLARARLFG